MGNSNSKDQDSLLNKQVNNEKKTINDKEKKKKETKKPKSEVKKQHGNSTISARTSEISASLAELNTVDQAHYPSEPNGQGVADFTAAIDKIQKRASNQPEPEVVMRQKSHGHVPAASGEETDLMSQYGRNATDYYHQSRDQAQSSASGGQASNLSGYASVQPRRHCVAKSAGVSSKRHSFLEPVDENKIARGTKSYADIQKAIATNAPIEGYDRYRATGSTSVLTPTPAAGHTAPLSLYRTPSTPVLPANPAALWQHYDSYTLPPHSTVRPRPRSGTNAFAMPACNNQPTGRTLNSAFQVQPTTGAGLEWSQHSASVPDLLSSDSFENSLRSNYSARNNFDVQSTETLDGIKNMMASVHSSLDTLHKKQQRQQDLNERFQTSIDTLNQKTDESEAILIQVTSSRNNVQPRS